MSDVEVPAHLADRNSRLGCFILQAHGWKFDSALMLMRAPNGQTLAAVSWFRMADMGFTEETLLRGGTPFDIIAIEKMARILVASMEDKDEYDQ